MSDPWIRRTAGAYVDPSPLRRLDRRSPEQREKAVRACERTRQRKALLRLETEPFDFELWLGEWAHDE